MKGGRTGIENGALGTHGIGALFILPGYIAWEPRCEVGGHRVVGCFDCDDERGVPVCVAGDAMGFVAGVEEEGDNGEEAEVGGEVEGGVGFVVEVRVLEAGRVVFDDALDEDQVVQVDGAAEADANVDPDGGVRLKVWDA